LEYAKEYLLKIVSFLESNWLYITWFILYFTIAWWIFGRNAEGAIFVLIIYTASITIALSPVGEFILRIMENCREPQTQQEQNYLLPMFEEVYENAKEIYPLLNSDIKIYIIDVMYVNAFAIGRKTIAVTRGALETFSVEELKGVIAHEFGHINYGHTKALLLSTIGNLFFTITVFIFRAIFFVFQIICDIFGHFNWLGFALGLFNFVASLLVEISVFLFINLSQIILSLNSRTNEIQADTFAYEIGYGRELTGALYLIDKISMSRDLTINQRLRASHPHTAKRIQNLERLESQELEETDAITA